MRSINCRLSIIWIYCVQNAKIPSIDLRLPRYFRFSGYLQLLLNFQHICVIFWFQIFSIFVSSLDYRFSAYLYHLLVSDFQHICVIFWFQIANHLHMHSSPTGATSLSLSQPETFQMRLTFAGKMGPRWFSISKFDFLVFFSEMTFW